jgi:hypothetical protein
LKQINSGRTVVNASTGQDVQIRIDNTSAGRPAGFTATEVDFYGGYGSTGVTINSVGDLSMDGDLIVDVDGTVSGDLSVGSSAKPTALFVSGDARVGGLSSNHVEISAVGLLSFVGPSAGLQYGEIWVKDNSTVTTLNSTSGKVQYTHFANDGDSRGSMAPDHTSDDITIGIAGDYLVTISLSIKNNAGASHVVDISVWINNGATELQNLHSHRTLGAGTDIGSVSMSGIYTFAASDTVELWLDTSRASNTNVTVEDCTMSIIQIGG